MPTAPPLVDDPPQATRSVVLWCLAAVLIVCVAVFVAMTRCWPMVGDAALMHYTVFLIQHGWTPYRDFLDINMPGAYAATALAMRLPGQPDVAWRIFDLALIALAGLGYYAIARPYSRFAALFATALLLLVHGQDGVQQAGQRDLVMATLLVLAVASLLEATRRRRWQYLVAFGVMVGLAATIKPTAGPLGAVLLGLAAVHRMGGWRDGTNPDSNNPGGKNLESTETSRRAGFGSALGWIAIGIAAMAAPIAAMLWWLERKDALLAWMQVERTLLPYYASLERRPFGFTLSHSISPLLPLVVLWLVCAVLRGPAWPRFERGLIAAAAVLSLLALLVQGKALPYQRYPMLAFLLLLIALDLTTAWRVRRAETQGARYAALAALCCGCLVIAPLALKRVHRFAAKPQAFDAMLAADLRSMPGELNGHVQCLDTIQDCLPTLYTLRLLPASGTLYDVFLFGDAEQPMVRAARHQFLTEVTMRPPALFIVTSGSFLDVAGGYRKLDAWPWFNHWLNEHYSLVAERSPSQPVRWWSRPQPPAGYRLYVRK